MIRQITKFTSVVCILLFCGAIFAQADQESSATSDVVTISIEKQFDSVKPGSNSALAVKFNLQKGWHFYASEKTAPGEMNLKIEPSGGKILKFEQPVFPPSTKMFDKLSDQNLDVFSDTFTVYLPFSVTAENLESPAEIKIPIEIKGAICSELQCQMPNFGELNTTLKIDNNAPMAQPKFTVQVSSSADKVIGTINYSLWFALGLAFVAGLSLNIMPCVWPVLPIVIMRLVNQAKENKSKSFLMGIAFCIGILLFFACLAGANIILHLFYGTVLQWGDQFRNPSFLTAMASFLVVLAIFMFGIFDFVLPSSIAGKSVASGGFGGSIGMGFLAAILSTPCSFGILAAVFAWVQTQPLVPATVTILAIGFGMALPYAVLTSMPQLLGKIPKAGRWMELFKQAIGFVLLAIAIKLISALPEVLRANALYFSVILAFCVWVWSKWVSYDTKFLRKCLTRVFAVSLALVTGFVFLHSPKPELINWQKYDADVIQKALDSNQPVLIKFTADWCLSCQVADKIVFSREDVANLIKEKNILAIKADTTGGDYPATIALKNIYNEPGVPVTLFYPPAGKEPVKWRGFNFADELKSELEKIQ